MVEKGSQTPSQPQSPKEYSFISEFDKRNALIEAFKFALNSQCGCQACEKLKIAAEVLEEDRKAGRTQMPSL